MPITFEPLTAINDHVSGYARLRLRAFGYTEPGVHGRARLRLRSRGTMAVSAAPAEPNPPVSGVHNLMLRASGTATSRGSIGGGCSLRLRARGFATRPGAVAGRTYLRLSVVGRAGTAGTGHALLVAQPPEVSAFGAHWFESPRDTLTLSESSATNITLVLQSILALQDTPAPHLDAKVQALSALNIRESLYSTLLLLLQEGLVLTDAASYSFQAIERIAARLLLTGEASDAAEAFATVAASLVLGEAVAAVFLEEVIDEAVFEDALATAANFVQAALDALDATDEATTVHTGMLLLQDGVTLGDGAVTEAELLQLLHDHLGMAVSLSLDNGQYLAWVVNTGSGGVSTYDNYPFNSFAALGGRYYGADSTGVYRLEGDTDDGDQITARLRLGMSDMGTRLRKSYSEVYVGYTGTGQMLLRLIFTDDASGEKMAALYRMKPRPAAGRRESRFETGRGISAVYFDFELENVDGADFDLSSIEFQPFHSNRRTRG